MNIMNYKKEYLKSKLIELQEELEFFYQQSNWASKGPKLYRIKKDIEEIEMELFATV